MQTDAGALAWELDRPIPEIPDDSAPHTVMLWRWLVDAVQMAQFLRPKVLAGDYPMTQFTGICNQAIKLVQELHELIPPPPPDPSKDPQNIAAREMIHAHVLSTIKAVEARHGVVR